MKKSSKKVKPKRNPKQKLLPAPAGKNLPAGRMTLDPQALLAAAIRKGTNIDLLNQLVSLGERLQAKAAESAFREAIAKFQFEISNISKTKSVNYTTKKGSKVEYEYAPLDFIIASVREPMFNNGLSFSFTTKQENNSVTAICHAHHVAGHTESTEFTVPVDPESYMNPAQAVATALTYSKRYSFCNAFGILTGDKDTDGNMGKKKATSGIESLPEFQNEDREKKIEEANKKFSELSEYVKKGFKILGYTEKQIYLFCDKFGWEDKKLHFEIDKIIKAKEGSK